LAKGRHWDQKFFDPIILPNGKALVTLRDAAHYITKLPKREHDAKEWQAALEALYCWSQNKTDRRCSRASVS
jgi:hypothetical protein